MVWVEKVKVPLVLMFQMHTGMLLVNITTLRGQMPLGKYKELMPMKSLRITSDESLNKEAY